METGAASIRPSIILKMVLGRRGGYKTMSLEIKEDTNSALFALSVLILVTLDPCLYWSHCHVCISYTASVFLFLFLFPCPCFCFCFRVCVPRTLCSVSVFLPMAELPCACAPRRLFLQVVSYTVDMVTNNSMTIRWQTNARGATALTKLRSDTSDFVRNAQQRNSADGCAVG